MLTKRNKLIVFLLALGTPLFVSGQVVITEIMYDPKDTDAGSGGEWIEVYNTGSLTVDLTQWIFFENDTNHGITADGTAEVPPAGYAVISRDLTVFKSFFSSYSGLLFKASFSLNDGEVLAMKENKDATPSDSVTYTSEWGGKNDGSSLQKVSSAWVAGTPTPGAQNVSGGTQTGNQTNPSTGTQSSSSSNSFPDEPQIFAQLRGPESGVAGADLTFSGVALGIQKQPIENARFLWTFGDGSTKEGEAVVHSYFLPGHYVLVLDVSSGRYSASERRVVTVVSPSITVQAIETGAGGFVELYNDASVELDLSNWHLRSAGKVFTLPPHTIILSRKSLRFPNQVTLLEPSGTTELLFPNGTVMSSYTPGQKTTPTPIKEKSVPASTVKTEKIVPPPADSAATGDSDTLPTSETNTTAAVISAQNTAVGSKQGPWVWYVLLGGVITVASLAYWFGGRREEGEFKIIEDHSE